MKFGIDEILTMIDKVKSTELSSFEYQDADTKIKIKGKTGSNKASKQSLPEQPAASHNLENCEMILSPMVGTFYTSPSEDAEPFVRIGDTIQKGQTVGIVEAMKLMNEIEAECTGMVEEILVRNEQMVEFGQPLMRVRKL